MDRVKQYFNIFLYVFFHFFIVTSLSCTEKAPVKNFPLIDSEIQYDYDRMIDAQKDNPLDKNSYEYSKKIINAEKEFLKNCSSINENNSLIGNWKLVDRNGSLIKNHSFLFNELISISKYENKLVLDNWGNRSVLYQGNENRYYIFSRGTGIIRMIKIEDNMMFVYIVKNNEWVLDPIHNNGEFIFKKSNDE